LTFNFLTATDEDSELEEEVKEEHKLVSEPEEKDYDEMLTELSSENIEKTPERKPIAEDIQKDTKYLIENDEEQTLEKQKEYLQDGREYATESENREYVSELEKESEPEKGAYEITEKKKQKSIKDLHDEGYLIKDTLTHEIDEAEKAHQPTIQKDKDVENRQKRGIPKYFGNN